MKKYTLSKINRLTGIGSIEFVTEEQIFLNAPALTYDIPKRINTSKTFTKGDTFSGTIDIYTITRIN